MLNVFVYEFFYTIFITSKLTTTNYRFQVKIEWDVKNKLF